MGTPKRRKSIKRNRGGGRPTLYKPTYAEVARRMCAQGATHADLADRFGVTIDTIVAWQFEHQAFSAACRLGQEAADDRVEPSLYDRAIGYTYDGEPIRECVPPDTRAAKFWLHNRRPDPSKQPEAEEDPLLAFLRSINGRVLRPVDPAQPAIERVAPAKAAIEVEYREVKSEPVDDGGPPRPIAGPKP